MRRLLITFAAMLTALPAGAAQSVSPVPSNEEIRKILVQRIDEAKQSVGIVVGVIEPSGRRIVSYGALAKGDKRPLDGNTVFEIGSISKVFTSLLMSDMVQRGELALNDPIAKYLPDGVKVPERGGRAYAEGSIHAYIGFASTANQHEPEGSGESLRRLFRRTDVSIPVWLRPDPRHWREVRILEPGRWIARPCARTQSRHGLRS